MRYYLSLLVFYTAACRPAGQRVAQSDSAMVYVKMDVNGDCRICRKPGSRFRRAFDRYYVDSSHNFYIRSAMLQPDSI